MTQEKLVTVAVAVYNNAPYISKCLVSVINQTYTNLEILVVDDGSKDSSLSICESFLYDSRVKILNKQNGGLSSSRQLALENASGDYICFIDADDYLEVKYVEMMLAKIVKDNSDICVCSAKFIDSITNKQIKGFYCEESSKGYRLTSSDLTNNTFPLKIYLSDSWDKMYRRSFLRDNNITFSLQKGFNGSDSLFNLKVALYEPQYSTISAANYVHVLYKNSAVHRKSRKLLEGFGIIIDQLVAEAIKIGKLENYKDFICNQFFICLIHGIQDEFNERKLRNESKFMFINRMKKFYNKFLYMYPFLNLDMSHKKTLSSKLFAFLFTRSPQLFLMYLTLRKSFTS